MFMIWVRQASLGFSIKFELFCNNPVNLRFYPSLPLPTGSGKIGSMSEIVLTTLNAKFIHAAFGLRYLYANLGTLQPRACLMEFDINQRPLDIAEGLLARNPKLIGFGVYIWNVTETLEVITAIRGVRPEVKIVLGGPEVSHETGGQAIVEWADHVITGEADLKFAEVCQSLLEPPAGKAKGDSAILLPRNCRIFPGSRCRMNFTATRIWRTELFMWRRRGDVRSRASFVCRRWTYRSGRFRWPFFWGRWKHYWAVV
jgi:hypothetical protein